MNQSTIKSLFPLLIVFLIFNALFIFAKKKLEQLSFDVNTLLLGNIVIFIVIVISFLLLKKALFSPTQQFFLKAVYGSFIIKFFVIAIVAFIYIQLSGAGINKPSVFSCLGLYILYTSLEITSLLRLLKEKKNA